MALGNNREGTLDIILITLICESSHCSDWVTFFDVRAGSEYHEFM